MSEEPEPAPKKAAVPTFAEDLVRWLVAAKGYRPGVPAEAAELADACDHALTFSDGMSFSIFCVVDAEHDDARRFTLPMDDVLRVGKACRKYTGMVSGAKLPVAVSIVEVRRAATEDDKQRLGVYKKRFFTPVVVGAHALSRATGEAWSTGLWNRWTGDLRRLLADPKGALEAPRAPVSQALAAKATPTFTIGIVAVLALFFLLEIALGIGPHKGATPALATLVALGGVSRALVDQGDTWRLFTAPLLHGDPVHLGMNALALFFGGVVLEALLGRAWLALLFVLGALGGSIASVLINEPNIVSVGASGAIMGLLAAAVVVASRLPAGERTNVQFTLGRILVPSLIPIATHKAGGHIDFAAHFGGAVVGGLLGLFVLRVWKRSDPRPSLRAPAAIVAAIGAAAMTFGVIVALSGHGQYAEAAGVALVPNEDRDELKAENAARLLQKYPLDPRVLYFSAVAAAQHGDLPGAEKQLRLALDRPAVFKVSFPSRQLEAAVRALLAAVLTDEGKPDEAREVARPSCDTGLEQLKRYCPPL